jgi:hypothetical protein
MIAGCDHSCQLGGSSAHALTVLREVCEQWQQVPADGIPLHDRCKLPQLLRRCSPHHGRLVVAQLAVELPQLGAVLR